MAARVMPVHSTDSLQDMMGNRCLNKASVQGHQDPLLISVLRDGIRNSCIHCSPYGKTGTKDSKVIRPKEFGWCTCSHQHLPLPDSVLVSREINDRVICIAQWESKQA